MRIIKLESTIDEAVLIQELHIELLAPLHLLQFSLLLLADVVELGSPLNWVILSVIVIQVSVCAVITE